MDKLKTSDEHLNLVPPNTERDAPASVEWLSGDEGFETMSLMGNTDESIEPSTIETETLRVQGLIDSADQLKWAIMKDNQPVGFAWVDLTPSDSLPSPSIHIIIGDKLSRGHGIGSLVTNAVIDDMKSEGKYDFLYSRHLIRNQQAADLMDSIGFEHYGEEYKDKDGLIWQNEKLYLKNN
jgi:RimJ/RimL family protein N-acetyltransferase